MLPANKTALVEYSNELWNYDFGQARRMFYWGVVAGLAPIGATFANAAPETVKFNSTTPIIPISNTTVWRCEFGDKIMLNQSGGYRVYQCVNPDGVDPGAVIGENGSEGTTVGDWLSIYGTGSTRRAATRYIAKRSREVWAIWDAAFMAAGKNRPYHELGHQFARNINDTSANGYATAGPVMSVEETFKYTDRIGNGVYMGGGAGGAPNTIMDYSVDYRLADLSSSVDRHREADGLLGRELRSVLRDRQRRVRRGDRRLRIQDQRAIGVLYQRRMGPGEDQGERLREQLARAAHQLA